MINADLPSMPIELNGFGQYAPEAYLGLTKREMFAMAAMQGLLATLTEEYDLSPRELAEDAVLNADALLAELEKSK